LRAKGILNIITDTLFQRKSLVLINITKFFISTNNRLLGEENGTVEKVSDGLTVIRLNSKAFVIEALKDL
jgi:hypothetical protein